VFFFTVARNVVEQKTHTLSKKQLTVELYKPLPMIKKEVSDPVDKDGTKKGEPKEQSSEEQDDNAVNTVKVVGMKHVSNAEAALWYFENKKRSNGGDIKDKRVDDEDDNILYLTFADPQGTWFYY